MRFWNISNVRDAGIYGAQWGAGVGGTAGLLFAALAQGGEMGFLLVMKQIRNNPNTPSPKASPFYRTALPMFAFGACTGALAGRIAARAFYRMIDR
jgi:hypothetical protein